MQWPLLRIPLGVYLGSMGATIDLSRIGSLRVYWTTETWGADPFLYLGLAHTSSTFASLS